MVGGSTYPFGNKDSQFARPNPYTVQNLLAKVPDGSWGKIKSLPVLKQKYADKYTVGTLVDTAKGYTYHYLELSARFDANLTDSWPGEAFEPIEVDENPYCKRRTESYGRRSVGELCLPCGLER